MAPPPDDHGFRPSATPDPRYSVRPQISDSNRSTTGTKDVIQQGLADACAGVRGSTPSAASGVPGSPGSCTARRRPPGRSWTGSAARRRQSHHHRPLSRVDPAQSFPYGEPLRRVGRHSAFSRSASSYRQSPCDRARRRAPTRNPRPRRHLPHSGLVPTPRAAETEHPQRARAAAERRMWTALPTVAVTTADHRTLTNFCAQAAADVGPPAVDSSEVLRALVRAMRGSAELRSWVRDELARSRSAPKPRSGPGDAAGPRSIELNSMDGRSASTPAPVVVLSRRGRHRAPPGH